MTYLRLLIATLTLLFTLTLTLTHQIHCPRDSPAVKPIFTFNHLKPTTTTPSYDAVFNITDANQFTHVFSNYADGAVKVSVNVVSVMYNLNPRNNCRGYLSAGTLLRS
ncbi:putative transmembrane protein GPR107/GPR108 [Helianthus debilis subsp. tardiflorus]